MGFEDRVRGGDFGLVADRDCSERIVGPHAFVERFFDEAQARRPGRDVARERLPCPIVVDPVVLEDERGQTVGPEGVPQNAGDLGRDAVVVVGGGAIGLDDVAALDAGDGPAATCARWLP